MICKYCKRPIEHAIEGYLICETCYSQDDRIPDQEGIAWLKSHCMDCSKPMVGGGYCPVCQAENDQALADLKLEHGSKTAYVHWRGSGRYVPTLPHFDLTGIFYYHVDHNPWGNHRPADGWPTIYIREWSDFHAVLNDHGVFVCCMSGEERGDLPWNQKRSLKDSSSG